MAYTGTIKDDIIEKVEVAFQLLKYLLAEYEDRILERYKLNKDEVEDILGQDLEENDKIYEVMQLISKKRGESTFSPFSIRNTINWEVPNSSATLVCVIPSFCRTSLNRLPISLTSIDIVNSFIRLNI